MPRDPPPPRPPPWLIFGSCHVNLKGVGGGGGLKGAQTTSSPRKPFSSTPGSSREVVALALTYVCVYTFHNAWPKPILESTARALIRCLVQEQYGTNGTTTTQQAILLQDKLNHKEGRGVCPLHRRGQGLPECPGSRITACCNVEGCPTMYWPCCTTYTPVPTLPT